MHQTLRFPIDDIKHRVKYGYWINPIKASKDSISQEEFFERFREGIEDSRRYGPLLIFGYDNELMEHPDNLNAIKSTISEGRRVDEEMFPGSALAILPERAKDSELEKLFEESEEGLMVRSKRDIRRGHILFGAMGFHTHNLDRSTYFGPESGNGVIYRDGSLFYHPTTQTLTTKFMKKFQRLQDKSY